jgi:hypothetical protein
VQAGLGHPFKNRKGRVKVFSAGIQAGFLAKLAVLYLAIYRGMLESVGKIKELNILADSSQPPFSKWALKLNSFELFSKIRRFSNSSRKFLSRLFMMASQKPLF